jgi:hypothetical protein
MTPRPWLWVALVCAASACATEEPVWMDQVESAHRAADAASSDTERRRAAERLEQAYLSVPADDASTVVWVRQDLCVRIGRAAFDRSELASALRWAERGLELSQVANIALADLLRLQGEALAGLGERRRRRWRCTRH